MANTLPQLIEEDVQRLDEILSDFLDKSEATAALVVDKGGFLICSQGDSRRFDLTTVAALASGAYLANQTIANLIHETNFNTVYQQGEKFSLFAISIDEFCLLLVIFKAQVSVGVVKYYAAPAAEQVARQMKAAQERDPGAGLDLSELNIADTRDIFKRRE